MLNIQVTNGAYEILKRIVSEFYAGVHNLHLSDVDIGLRDSIANAEPFKAPRQPQPMAVQLSRNVIGFPESDPSAVYVRLTKQDADDLHGVSKFLWPLRPNPMPQKICDVIAEAVGAFRAPTSDAIKTPSEEELQSAKIIETIANITGLSIEEVRETVEHIKEANREASRILDFSSLVLTSAPRRDTMNSQQETSPNAG